MTDKAPIQLEGRKRQRVQYAKRGIASSKVVEVYLNLARCELVDDRLHHRQVVHHRGLSKLQLQRARVEIVRFQAAVNLLHQVVADKLTGGKVQADGKISRLWKPC